MADVVEIAVIGGSGLYKMEELEVLEEKVVSTPFGEPSDALIIGQMKGVKIAFLARHGRGHTFLPTEVNYRANIWALKSIGVKWILSFSAVGSLKEEHRPTDLVIPLQFIDRTRHRADTFFGKGAVAHVAFGDPICPALADILFECAKAVAAEDQRVHKGGTYVCMEGPTFSTKAESELHRSWGAEVIGMTNLTEAKLAREAEIAYSTLAMITDYDCWHPDHESVTVEMVMGNLKKNSATAQKVCAAVIGKVSELKPKSIAHNSLATALMSDPNKVPEDTRKALDILTAPYWPRVTK